MLAPCGLLCNNCEAYIATQANDQKAIDELATKWSKLFGAEILPEHIPCDGCTSDGKKSFYCGHICEIKKCLDTRELENCGLCADFACSKLAPIYEHEPEAKSRLEGVNQ